MEPEIKTQLEQTDMDVNLTESGSLTTVSSQETESEQQFENIKNTVINILSELPDYVGGFFNQYQKPIVTVSLAIAAFISLKVLFAMVDAVNDIPLLAPMFELVGMGYSAWFVYRYMLRASTREELLNEINGIKQQYLGDEEQ